MEYTTELPGTQTEKRVFFTFFQQNRLFRAYGCTAKSLDSSFGVLQKTGTGAFSVETLRVSTLKLPIPSFLRSASKSFVVTFGSAARMMSDVYSNWISAKQSG